MKKPFKKPFKKPIVILAAMATVTSVLTGCGSKTSGSGGGTMVEKTEDSGTDGETGGEITYPLTDTRELTYWLTLNPNVSANFINLGDTVFGKALQEQTGITIKFRHTVAGQVQEQFNLMIADGNLTDIMEWSWARSYPGGPEKAIKDGVIIPLNDVFDKYCPNIKKYLAENPDVDKMIKTDEGNYFVFPFISGNDKLCYTIGGFLRKDWLDELGLSVPATIDEWHTILTAFKEKKGAVAPLCFDWSNFRQSNPFAFTYKVGGDTRFILDDEGKIVFSPAAPGYKDYLITMNQWYQEGLIDKDLATLNGNQVTAKMTSDQSGASVGWAGSRMQMFMTSAQKNNPHYLLVPTPVPTLEKGVVPEYGYMANRVSEVGTAITTSCRDVELAARLLDYGYSDAGHKLFNYGVEGVSYDEKEGKAVYTDLVMNNPDGWPLAQSLSKYVRANYNGPFVQDANYLDQYLQLPTVKDCPTVWAVPDAHKYRVPMITPTQEESRELATITIELNAYVDEMELKFIFGTESFEKWDEYIRTLKDMKLDRALEIQNAALARYQYK